MYTLYIIVYMKYKKISNKTVEYFNVLLNNKFLTIRTVFNNSNIDRCDASNKIHDLHYIQSSTVAISYRKLL